MRPVTSTPSSSSTCIFLGLFVCSGTSHVNLLAIPPSSSSTCIFLGLFVCNGTSHANLIAIPLSLGDLLQGSEWLSNLYLFELQHHMLESRLTVIAGLLNCY